MAVILKMTVAHRYQFIDILDLMRRDLEHAARLRIARGQAQHGQQPGADIADRVVRFSSVGILRNRFEQVGLVAEVPVDRAARDSSLDGNVLQGGARYALALEQQLRRIDDAVAGDKSVLLGPACHKNAPVMKTEYVFAVRFEPHSAGSAYIHSC